MAHPGEFRGISRGVFGLKSWDPLRKPGEPAPAGALGRGQPLAQSAAANASAPRPQHRVVEKTDPRRVQSTTVEAEKMVNTNGNLDGMQKPAQEGKQKLPKKFAPMVAKYSYTANPDSPLEQELSVKQKDKLKFIACHAINEQWWKAENEAGEQGYLPASYMLVIEMNELPWLQRNEPEEESEEQQGKGGIFGLPPKGVYKPYQPTFSHKDLKKDEKFKPNYHCALCEKTLNGPAPYSAHMASKAHKENLEIAREEGWLHEIPGFENS